jgi:uncharacterized protein (TIGR01244 family)
MHKRLPALIALAALVACSDSDRPAAATVDDPVPCVIEGLRNCAQTGDLVFASQPSADALEYLAAQGYRTVVSTRAADEIEWDERAVVESLGMTFVQIPMEAPVTGISDEQVAAFAELMERREGPMLLHCGSGNRVSGLWGAWLVEYQGADSAEALRLAALAGMTRVRPVVERRLGSDGR